MAADDVSKTFQNLKIKESQDINILLLGETGVGKSTFINAVANYFHFRTFKKAFKAEELLILIPSIITVTNEQLEQVTITVGKSDNNEFQEIGAAGTQDVKTYVFPIGEGKTRLRLIDSPGMGDPRGIEQDDINCENILAYLSQLQELHAICFLMRPTTTRRTVLFEYCVKQILSRLEKSASKNIIFIFTNTRGSNYGPGDTLPCLRTVIEDIKGRPPHVDIPLKDNIFSLDNEAFRILVAMKKSITFSEEIQQRFIESWNKSASECWRFISYIVGDASRDGLKPHQLANTISINEARKIIVQLSQPLVDITQLIHDNLRILDRHKKNLSMENQSLDEMKRKLYIPVITLQVTQLTQPVTVCTSAKCADLIKVENVQKWHYRQRCHDPCYLTNVNKEIIGDPNLVNCAAMGGARVCQKCTCDYTVHMHVYYLTKTVNDKIEDQIVKNSINKKEEALREGQRLMNQIDERKRELEDERDIIIKSTAQFAHFLQHNAISPFNDSYKAYIEYLISREKSLGRNGDPEVIYNLEQLLHRYELMKTAFENSLQMNTSTALNAVGSSITAQTVIGTIHSLYKLKHNGQKIKELLKKQKASRTSEYDKNCEYVHPKSSDLSQAESKKKKDKKKDGKSTDDDKKNVKSKKDGKSTDDERKQKKSNYSKNYQHNQGHRPHTHTQNVSHPVSNPGQWRDAPPSYEASRNHQPHYPNNPKNPKEEPKVVVKVELSQPGKKQKSSDGQHQQGHAQYDYSYQDQQVPYQSQGAYGSASYYGGPTGHYQGQYHGPPPGQYHGPPSGQYHGPPSGPYHGPPSGPYHGPPSGPYHGPHSGPYYGPPQGPPASPYYGPPQGQYNGPPSGYHGPPQGQYHGPPQGHYNRQYSKNNQGTRGRGGKQGGGGGKRGRSKPRHSKKSGTEKSTSDSDSSSD